MSGNDFLLPDELGWECNDELQDLIDDWMQKTVDQRMHMGIVSNGEAAAFMRTSKAQLIDDMYAKIKKYQAKEKSHATTKTSH